VLHSPPGKPAAKVSGRGKSRSALEKAHGFFNKAAGRYQDDENLQDGNAHLAAALYHYSQSKDDHCHAAVEAAEPRYTRAASRYPADSHVQNGMTHFAAAMHKIDFAGPEPQDSPLQPSNPATDPDAPAKQASAAIANAFAKRSNEFLREVRRQVAFAKLDHSDRRVIGTALPRRPRCWLSKPRSRSP